MARKKKNNKEARDPRSGGENDPDMAFALLNRMMNEGITPNGVTYCALIDVCSRCRRNGTLFTMIENVGYEVVSSERILCLCYFLAFYYIYIFFFAHKNY